MTDLANPLQGVYSQSEQNTNILDLPLPNSILTPECFGSDMLSRSISSLMADARLSLKTAAAISQPRRPITSVGAHDFPPLAAGFFHEWCRDDSSQFQGVWHPPLTLMVMLALSASDTGRILWIGRRCWPTLQILCSFTSGAMLRKILDRSVFLDPLTDDERNFAVAQGLRCAGLSCVVADASGMNLMTSRRLQLAAEASKVLGLLARPPWEINQPSYAASRWRVRPRESDTRSPQWEIELHSCRGQPAQDAPRRWIGTWNYQVFRGSGAVHFSPDVGRRSVATQGAGQSKTA